MTAPLETALDIAVGVLVDSAGRVLIARRRAHTPGAGFWEFPGGKREAGEAIDVCLARELAEEIGIDVKHGEPLVRFAHDRGPRPVRLHVWRIDDWQGQPSGLEGQVVRWAEPGTLDLSTLLPATEVIINALRLPSCYLITPGLADGDPTAWLAGIDHALADGIALIRMRDPALDDAAYEKLAAAVVERAHAAGGQVLVDRDVALMQRVGADGLHWPAQRVIDTAQRPVDRRFWYAASAHDGDDVKQAATAGVDFATLSPVLPSRTHPETTALGWSGFAEQRDDQAAPVYALGGLSGANIDTARAYNAQGVAAIRGFWPGG